MSSPLDRLWTECNAALLDLDAMHALHHERRGVIEWMRNKVGAQARGLDVLMWLRSRASEEEKNEFFQRSMLMILLDDVVIHRFMGHLGANEFRALFQDPRFAILEKHLPQESVADLLMLYITEIAKKSCEK